MDKGTLNIPILYPLDFIKKGGRKTHVALLPDVAVVEIDCISAADTQLAVEATMQRTDGKKHRIRRLAFEDRLFTATQRPVWPSVDQNSLPGLLGDPKCSLKLFGQTRLLPLWAESSGTISDALPLNADTVLHNGRDEMIDAVRAACGRFVFIDGALHEECLAPALRVWHTTNDSSTLYADLRQMKNANKGLYLRLEAWRDADQLRQRFEATFPWRTPPFVYAHERPKDISVDIHHIDHAILPSFPESEVNILFGLKLLAREIAETEWRGGLVRTEKQAEARDVDHARLARLIESPGRAGARGEVIYLLINLLDARFHIPKLRATNLSNLEWIANFVREGLELSLDPDPTPDHDADLGLLKL